MRIRLIATGVIGVALFWAATAAQQTQPRPGPGSGIVTVEGTVDIRNMPAVRAAQQGEWRVSITNVPTVIAGPVPFLKAGQRYQITWSTGERELVRTVAMEPGGWVRVADTPDRWINLGSARSISLAP